MNTRVWLFRMVVIVLAGSLTSCRAVISPTPAIEQSKAAPAFEQAKATPAIEQSKAAPAFEQATNTPNAAPVTITIFVGFGGGGEPEQMKVHQQLADEFNASHKDIQIEFINASGAEVQTKFTTMLAGDMAPDIVLPTGVGGVALFFDEWADMTPFIKADNYDMSRFTGKTVETHTYPNKGIIGLPLCVYPTALAYNADIFDVAGVEYPPHAWGAPYADGEPWTYDKLREIARLVSLDVNGNNSNDGSFDPKNMKQYGFDELYMFLEPAIKFGDKWGGVVDATNYRKSAILDRQFVDYMTWLKENIWTYHITANAVQSGAFFESAADPFASGMLAMAEIHTWWSTSWGNWTSAFKWDLAALPRGPNGKILSLVDADTVVIPKSGKHQQQAWEVIKWFFENKQLKRLIDNYGCMPAERTLATSWVEEMKTRFPNIDMRVYIDAMDYLEPSPNHEAWVPQPSKIRDVASSAWGQIFTGTNLDVTAVLTEADREIQQILDDYWKERELSSP